VAEDGQGGVGLGLNKSQSEEVRGEPVVPSLGHLLQQIERLLEAVDPVRLRGINKPYRLAVVDCLYESTMQECILHINLVDRPRTWDGQGKHHVDSGRLDNRVESPIVLDVGALGEVVKDPPSLVPFQGAIGVELVLEDPFVDDDIGANRMRDKISSVVGDENSIFFLRGMTPRQVGEGGADGGGHQRERQWWGG
jgi:hypothetical protein